MDFDWFWHIFNKIWRILIWSRIQRLKPAKMAKTGVRPWYLYVISVLGLGFRVPPQKKSGGKTSSKSTKWGAGEHFTWLDCRAKVNTTYLFHSPMSYLACCSSCLCRVSTANFVSHAYLSAPHRCTHGGAHFNNKYFVVSNWIPSFAPPNKVFNTSFVY